MSYSPAHPVQHEPTLMLIREIVLLDKTSYATHRMFYLTINNKVGTYPVVRFGAPHRSHTLYFLATPKVLRWFE